jgi:hypothetical protein
MKRTIIILFAISAFSPAYCDVIFTPLQYNFFSYSGELVFNYEILTGPKKTTCYWGGAGVVGSITRKFSPTLGAEIAVEKRRYFERDSFKHFFLSSYLGLAYMWNPEIAPDWMGIIPGLKINYKAQISKRLVAEPYVSLSLPFTFDARLKNAYFPIPVFTIGARVGITKLKDKYSNSAL